MEDSCDNQLENKNGGLEYFDVSSALSTKKQCTKESNAKDQVEKFVSETKRSGKLCVNINNDAVQCRNIFKYVITSLRKESALGAVKVLELPTCNFSADKEDDVLELIGQLTGLEMCILSSQRVHLSVQSSLNENSTVFFQQHTLLTCLDISFNSFSIFPAYLKFLIHLRILKCDYNHLKRFSAKSIPTSIVEVYARSNIIDIIEEDISDLVNLQVLNLSSNQISAIPQSFQELDLLMLADFSSNLLQFLPNLSKFQHLQKLLLSSNKVGK